MKIVNRYWFFLIFYGILLAIFIFPFYRDGSIILGGEGNYWLDFSVLIKNYAHAWQNKGIGDYNLSLNALFPNVPILTLLQKIIPSDQIINFLLIFSLYFLPFLGMLVLCREFKTTPFIAFLTSLFYVMNPFSLMFLYSLNQWNVLVLFGLPLFFGVILKFYQNNLKLFFYFGLTTLFLSFINVNPPLIAINLISVAIAVLITAFYLDKKVNLIKLFKKYLLLALSFILFNAWWLANWLYILADVQNMYTKQFAISWLKGTMEFVPAAFRTLNLTMLLPDKIERSYNFFNDYYSLSLVLFVFSLPLFILLYAFCKKKFGQKYLLLLALTVFLAAFLAKGIHGIFGGFYEFAVFNFPFFSIFKSASEKWGVLYVFLLSLLLALILKGLRNDKHWRLILLFFLIYLSFNIVPLISGNFIPDYRFDDNFSGSRNFFDKKEYQELRAELNSGSEQYRVLSLPGSQNYQVALQVNNYKFYTGNDPVLHNTNKAFIAPYNHNDQASVLFKTISEPRYLNLFGFYNIKKIVINKDMYPWFGFQEEESIPEIEEILDRNFDSSKNETISLYDVGDHYLSRFYVPKEIVYSPGSNQYALPDIIDAGDFSKRTGFFINPYKNEAIENEAEFENDLVKQNFSQILVVGDIQSVIDEAKLREGIGGMNPSGVLFPYARWKPGSFVYPYILKREERVKNQFSDQPEEMFEQHLFFAAKRVTEIQKWDRRLTEDKFVEILTRYKSEMQGAIQNLDTINQKGKETFMLLAKLEVSFGAHEERLLNVVKGNYGEESTRFELTKSVLTDIDSQLKMILEERSQVKYYFEVPQEGEYEIIVENLGISPEWELENVTPDINDKFIISLSEQQDNDKKWLSFGRKYFKQDEYWLKFIKPASQNLLTKDWQKLESKIEIDEKSEFFGETGGLTIYQDIENWKPQVTYRFSFEYKTSGEGLKVLLVEEREEIDTAWLDKGVADERLSKSNILIEKQLEGEDNVANEWQRFDTVINSDKNAKSARLSIISESAPKHLNEITLRNVQLRAIIEPKIVLKKTQDSNNDIPKITFQKINPTKYLVNIENAVSPYFLIFSESFHRGWKAYINNELADYEGEIVGSYFDGQIREEKAQDEFFDKYPFQTWGKKPLPDDRHIIMNGYANSWYITPEDAGTRSDYQIIVEYQGQWFFYLGALITLITIIATLAVAFWRKLKSIKS